MTISGIITAMDTLSGFTAFLSCMKAEIRVSNMAATGSRCWIHSLRTGAEDGMRPMTSTWLIKGDGYYLFNRNNPGPHGIAVSVSF